MCNDSHNRDVILKVHPRGCSEVDVRGNILCFPYGC